MIGIKIVCAREVILNIPLLHQQHPCCILTTCQLYSHFSLTIESGSSACIYLKKIDNRFCIRIEMMYSTSMPKAC